jgi:hypothetical protein
MPKPLDGLLNLASAPGIMVIAGAITIVGGASPQLGGAVIFGDCLKLACKSRKTVAVS